ncbi:MAG: condensation domain-containing protein [Candidatus Binataceae bacterium]
MQNALTQLKTMSADDKRNLLSQLVARKAAAEQALPLSFAEERLCYLDTVEPGNRAYVMSAAASFTGTFDVAAFKRAVNEVVRRHESLRTFYVAGADGPVRAIAPTLTVDVPLFDLSSLGAAEQQAAVLSNANADSLLNFSLSELPLFRIVIIRLGPNEHVSLAAVHHIIFDHWSTQIFHREVMAQYHAICAGQASPLPELPIQLSDFARWQRECLQGAALDGQLEYWRRKMAGVSTLELPTDRPRPAIKTYAAATLVRTLPAELAEALRQLSRRHGATMFMVLLTCFKIMLHYYSRQDDVVVGIDVAGRNRAEAEPLIGFFVNELPLRTDLSGNPDFEELLARVRETCLEAYAHQDVPFNQIVKLLSRARDLSRAPIFQAKLAVVKPGIPESTSPGLVVKSLDLAAPATELDLTLFIEDTQAGFVATIQYNSDLFENSTIALMMHRLGALFEAVARGSNLRLDRLLEELRHASPPPPPGQSSRAGFHAKRTIAESRKQLRINTEAALDAANR